VFRQLLCAGVGAIRCAIAPYGPTNSTKKADYAFG